jgi:hypothetical protein
VVSGVALALVGIAKAYFDSKQQAKTIIDLNRRIEQFESREKEVRVKRHREAMAWNNRHIEDNRKVARLEGELGAIKRHYGIAASDHRYEIKIADVPTFTIPVDSDDTEPETPIHLLKPTWPSDSLPTPPKSSQP